MGFLLELNQKVGNFKKVSILSFLKFKAVKVLKLSVFNGLNDLLKQFVGAISLYLVCDFKLMNWYCSSENRSNLKSSFLNLTFSGETFLNFKLFVENYSYEILMVLH